MPAKPMLAGLALLLASLGAMPVMALESDASAPIEVVADRLELDNRAGTAIYIGDVEIQQGSMKLIADRVVIERNDQGEVTLVTATGEGERAYLEQKPAPDEAIVKGWGNEVVYHAGQRRVELINDAELHQAGDIFHGAYVEYFLDRRQVQARSETEGGQRKRVRMTLTPQNSPQ